MGMAALAALYPDDFELYLFALELLDSQNKVVEYFLFPINPSAVSKSTSQLVNIKKTAGGINAISTDTYQPSVVSLSGNFGRKFKILLGADYINFSAFSFSEQSRKNKQNNVFSNTVKTGYGCIKILERIITKSSQFDSKGNPYSLNFYNLSFGDSHLVKVIGEPVFDTSLDKNMIWAYNFKMMTLASLDQLSNYDEFSNLKLLAFSTVQKSLNGILSNVEATL